ncbi:MAG: hypothetical protein OXH39_11050 [Candidatus Poribacteria bacterium]|nr:hypothetical protein [Candidatus Poribacteria bacterium]
MFKRKWYWAPTAVVVLCISGIVLFLKPKTETQEPIKIYKAVTPDPKTRAIKETGKEETGITPSHSHNHDHSHGHSHETVPHSHGDETNIGSSGYDWRDESAFDAALPKSDPWKQTHPESEPTDTADDTYPPRDWYKTEDPELHAEYLYAQLLKQFGDIPEVHTVGEHNLNVAKGVPQTLGNIEAYLEANYYLFPNEKNKKAIEDFQEIKASGATMSSESSE